jgi:hypothetical protein
VRSSEKWQQKEMEARHILAELSPLFGCPLQLHDLSSTSFSLILSVFFGYIDPGVLYCRSLTPLQIYIS